MKRVIVTGANGFIGRNVLRLLADKGFEVHGIVFKNSQRENLDCLLHTVDLFDTYKVKGLLNKIKASHLLHFAWDVTPGQYWNSDNNLSWLQASLELINIFKNCGGQRIVGAGTCAEYDLQNGYCLESLTPTRPNSLYGVCKLSLQSILDIYSQNHGLSYAWGRIFFLYGPHEKKTRLVPAIVRSLLLSEPAKCSHGNQIRDFLCVEDVAEAFVQLLDSDIHGPINIGSGEPVRLREIITKIAVKIGRVDLVNFGELVAPDDEPGIIVADTRRLTGELDWRPRYSLEEGLDLTIDWWKKQLGSNNGNVMPCM